MSSLIGIVGFVLWIIGIMSCFRTRWWLGVLVFFVAPLAVIEGLIWAITMGNYSASQHIFDKVAERK